MTRSLTTRLGSRSGRALIPTVAITGIGAVLALAAVPSSAQAAAHHAAASHRTHPRVHHLAISGLVAAHHGSSMTVFAKTAKVGAKAAHNERIRVTFSHTAHGTTKISTGDHVHLLASGTTSGHHFTVVRRDEETVTPASATLFFGAITAITGNLLTVSEVNRDNGDLASGEDHHGGGDDGSGDGGDHDSSRNHGDDSPGGPGGPGNGGSGNAGPGHQVTIDDSAASITVNGAAGTLAVGDTVAVLGESTSNTIVAADVFGFAATPAFLRGDISAISGDSVTIGDDRDGHGGGHDSKDDDNDDSPVTLSLTGVPLALNGDEGATTSQLAVGEKLVVIGTSDAATGTVTPDLAFAFNDHDHDHSPCGHNGGDDNDGHGGDDGSDG